MVETHDTIKGLLAEFRGYSHGMPASYHVTMSWADFRKMLDRFDAANKREVQNALDAGGFVEASRKNKQVGNAAKLREALETLRELLGDLLRLGDAEYHDDFSNFCDIIDAALAAPPRNCDVYNNESCRMAYHLHGDGLMTMQAFADWLYAPTTEKEGGNNANK